MKIGCTYDLRDEYLRYGFSEEEAAECDPLETIQAVVATLASLGHQVERIGGVRKLTACLARGDRWDLVFNFAEGLYGFGREAQVPALLDAFQIPYTFSDALVLALTLHKGMTKHIVRDLGVPTPAFVVVSEESDVEKVNLPYPLFVKPVASGSSVGISAASRVADPSALRSTCRQLLRRFHQPAIVESFLPGRELTVGLVGTGPRARVLGVMEVVCSPEAEPHASPFRTSSGSRRSSSTVSPMIEAPLRPPIWRGECGPVSDAGTPDGWTAAVMRPGSRTFSRSILWPVSPRRRISRFSPACKA